MCVKPQSSHTCHGRKCRGRFMSFFFNMLSALCGEEGFYSPFSSPLFPVITSLLERRGL
jgi:hypothetical protein